MITFPMFHTRTDARNGGIISNRIFVASVIIIISGMILIFAKTVSEPWINGYTGSDGAFLSTIAHNYLQYGPLKLHLGQATNSGAVTEPSRLHFYQHHPPLLPLTIAASFALLGEREASARLVPIIFTICNTILICIVARKLYGELFALAATFLFATFPAILFFGAKVGYEAPTTFFILLSLFAYIRVVESNSSRWLTLLFVAVGLGLWTDWPAFFMVPFISIHCLRNGRPHFRRIVGFGLPVFAVLMFLLFVLQSYLADSSSVMDMVGQGLVYARLLPADSAWNASFKEAKVNFTLGQFARQIAFRMDQLFSYPLIALSIIGIYGMGKQKDFKLWIPLILLAVACLNAVLFFKGTYINFWWSCHFAAPLCILTVGGLLVCAGTDGFSAQAGMELWRARAPLVFLILLVLLGNAPKLKNLNEPQIRFLPEGKYENVSFIKDLAQKIRSATDPSDTVLIEAAMESVRPLSYYSGREVFDNIGSVEALNQWTDKHPGSKWFLLTVKPQEVNSNPGSTWEPIQKAEIVSELMVDGYCCFTGFHGTGRADGTDRRP